MCMLTHVHTSAIVDGLGVGLERRFSARADFTQVSSANSLVIPDGTIHAGIADWIVVCTFRT